MSKFVDLFKYFNISLVFLSCSNIDKKSPEFSSVDFSKDVKVYSKPYISEKRSRLNTLGPNIEGVEEEQADSFVVSVVLAPALYKSLSYLPVLECMKREGLDFHYISGIGFSSLVAALYATYGSIEPIEWKLHKLERTLSKTTPYSRSWIKKINEFINDEINVDRIEKTKISLAMQVYLSEKRNLELITRGNLKKTITDNITLEKSGVVRSPLYSNSREYISTIRKVSDYTIFLNALGDSIKISKIDGKVLSFYTKQSGFNKNELNGSDLELNINASDAEIDDISQLNNIVDGGRKFCRNNITNIVKLFRDKKVESE